MNINPERLLKNQSLVRKNGHLGKWLLTILVFTFLAILFYGLFLAVDAAGLGSSHAAGWMQAIGTVIAVAAAVLIAQYQSQATLNSISDAQRLADQSKKTGTLAVVRAALSHASKIEAAVADKAGLAIYEVYDKTVIEGLVKALSAAPLYELGSPEAVAALLSARDQFVFLGNQVEEYIAGPWGNKDVRPELEKLREPQYAELRAKTLKSSKEILAGNVLFRVKCIKKQCEIIESALASK